MTNLPAISTLSPYLLLFAAIAMVWLPVPVQTGALSKLTPAVGMALIAMAAALALGLITPVAALVLLVLGALLFASAKSSLKFYLRLACGVIALILALALAMHKVAGFHNPLLLDQVRFSNDAQAFSLYANFDKGMVGFLLLTLFCQRAANLREFLADGKRIAFAAALTIVVLITLGLGLQFFRLDPKLPEATLLFLSVNLFLTCVAEEAFFRGFIQEALYRSSSKPLAAYLALLISALLFGMAHLGGGPLYAGLATVAGLGYGYVYHLTRRIEWAILTHFGFNLCHFVFFTYPKLV
ncbi:CPBP family intramembrane glutamic endopeptidase [Undibacterium sp. TS12]|uniref:CPBP family intramembrane glutamic endopeptidase n=1 Tax=Undibacterium sp. TS12 TaxID=2908202 RepID=UPI001F4CBAA1|nr:CPBP family intramembrane glutamic endopeptidase [Undibacterium sp. TS12]MCH8618076.1 CPBP family intramembrane metalloprotease [Undibacterium sp. TS12]